VQQRGDTFAIETAGAGKSNKKKNDGKESDWSEEGDNGSGGRLGDVGGGRRRESKDKRLGYDVAVKPERGGELYEEISG
jgi:hypothetical protein